MLPLRFGLPCACTTIGSILLPYPTNTGLPPGSFRPLSYHAQRSACVLSPYRVPHLSPLAYAHRKALGHMGHPRACSVRLAKAEYGLMPDV